MMAIASKIRFRDQGLALTVTAGLHIAVIAWLGTVEMHETFIQIFVCSRASGGDG